MLMPPHTPLRDGCFSPIIFHRRLRLFCLPRCHYAAAADAMPLRPTRASVRCRGACAISDAMPP